MLYKISCRKSVRVSTPKNHLNELLRRKNIKSNWEFSSQWILEIRTRSTSWGKKLLIWWWWWWWCSIISLQHKSCQVLRGILKKLRLRANAGLASQVTPSQAGKTQYGRTNEMALVTTVQLPVTCYLLFFPVASIHLPLSIFSALPLALCNAYGTISTDCCCHANLSRRWQNRNTTCLLFSGTDPAHTSGLTLLSLALFMRDKLQSEKQTITLKKIFEVHLMCFQSQVTHGLLWVLTARPILLLELRTSFATSDRRDYSLLIFILSPHNILGKTCGNKKKFNKGSSSAFRWNYNSIRE